jgi:uncharacterized SAM-binding protein YcdF (DUF218 family)
VQLFASTYLSGIARPVGPSAGAQMGRFAMTLSAAHSVIAEEGLAQSTLQNACLSPMIPNAERIINVTEAFHLPRSMSFRWAQWELGHPADISSRW